MLCLLALSSCSGLKSQSGAGLVPRGGIGGAGRGVGNLVGKAGSAVKGLVPGKKKSKAGEAPDPADNPLTAAPMQIPVGVVHFLHPDGEFVLIKSSQASMVEAGTSLTAYGSGGVASARLEASPARKGGFITADLIEGRPSPGDQVLMEHVMQAPAPGGGLGGTGSDVQVLE